MRDEQLKVEYDDPEIITKFPWTYGDYSGHVTVTDCGADVEWDSTGDLTSEEVEEIEELIQDSAPVLVDSSLTFQ